MGIINRNAVVDIQTGATIDLSVAANSAQSAAAGDFTGTLHLRAPQTHGQPRCANQSDQRDDYQRIPNHCRRLRTLQSQQCRWRIITTRCENDVFANGTTFAGNQRGDRESAPRQ